MPSVTAQPALAPEVVESRPLQTGEEFWRYRASSTIFFSPAVAGGVVYVGNLNHYLYALAAASSEVLWRFETGGFVGSSPAVGEGVVYFGSYDGNVYAIR